MADTPTERPSMVQIEAAKLRIVTDRRLGKVTPDWIRRLAEGLPAQEAAAMDEALSVATLQERCLTLLRKFHADRGDWNGDPWEEHPYHDAGKPWFFEDDAAALAEFVRSEITAAVDRNRVLGAQGPLVAGTRIEYGIERLIPPWSTNPDLPAGQPYSDRSISGSYPTQAAAEASVPGYSPGTWRVVQREVTAWEPVGDNA